MKYKGKNTIKTIERELDQWTLITNNKIQLNHNILKLKKQNVLKLFKKWPMGCSWYTWIELDDFKCPKWVFCIEWYTLSLLQFSFINHIQKLIFWISFFNFYVNDLI